MTLARALNEQRVLEALHVEGPQSESRLAQLTGLSMTTVTSLVRDLQVAGFIRRTEAPADGTESPSRMYETVRQPCFVFGADVGGTKIRAGIADAYGEVLIDHVEATRTESSTDLVRQLAEVFERLEQSAGIDRRSVLGAGIGMPGVYDVAADHISAAPNLPDLSQIAVADTFSGALGVPVIVDNDVNLAAVGERWRGLGVEHHSFVAISIGTGVGMGVFINGELWRGHGGAAGEIDSLQIGTGATLGETDRRLEATVSASAILMRLRSSLDANRITVLSHKDDVAAIFEAASRGDELATQLLDDEAEHIALAIAAVAAVLDPSLVVLGGGVGSSPFLLDPVRRHVARMHPRPVEIEISALGDAAAFHGAIAVALRAARRRSAANVQGSGGGDGAR